MKNFQENLQGEFAGVVARASCRVHRDIEGLSPFGDASRRGRNSPFEAREAERQVDGLFEGLLAQSFG